MDFPEVTPAVVKTPGNWEARLAVAANCLQRDRRALILPQRPCLRCLYDSPSYFGVYIA